MYSIFLIGGLKIDVTESELLHVLREVSLKSAIIQIGEYSFAGHQFSHSMPKDKADFLEKMELRKSGFYRCKKGAIHKLGEGRCDCYEMERIASLTGPNAKTYLKPTTNV